MRTSLLDAGHSLDGALPEVGRTLAEELLEPTAIYTDPMLALAGHGLVHAAAHITGGGWSENLPRMLPEGLGAVIDPRSWQAQPIFGVVAAAAGLQPRALFDVLNMGIGMVAAVPAGEAGRVVEVCRSAGAEAIVVGEVVEGSGLSFAT